MQSAGWLLERHIGKFPNIVAPLGTLGCSDGAKRLNTYAIIGGTLWGNRGAEAMVVTTVGRIRDRDPGSTFLIMSYLPHQDRELISDSDVRVVDASPRATLVHFIFAVACRGASKLRLRIPDSLLPGSVRAMRRCRALFDVSGISFHDGRLAVVAYNLLCLGPAVLLGIPVVRLSQAMGPFENRLNRVSARWATIRSVHTFARGRITAEYMRGLSVPTESWSVASDVAFSFRESDSLSQENVARMSEAHAMIDAIRANGTEVVALVPSSLLLRKTAEEDIDYLAQLRVLIHHLQRRGLHVLVMPNATREGSDKLRNNDIAVVTALMEQGAMDTKVDDPGGVTYVDFDLNTAAIRSLIAKTVVVVTSRFHAMVAALALGVPSLVMGWSHKYVEVLEEFGCAHLAVDFSDVETGLIPMVDRLLLELGSTSDRIAKSLPDVVASSENQFDILERLPPSM